MRLQGSRSALRCSAALALTMLFGNALFAGSTGTTALLTAQGSGGGTAFGDYVSDANALDTFYRFFVEVPPGQSRLVVDIFDADIGLGGATEDTAGRDRDRNGFDTAAQYSILGPDGVARTPLFTTGNTTLPAGSDNAWLSLLDTTGDSVRDNFGANAYTNNDGTLNWSTNWIETNDDNNATNGQMRVTGGELRFGDNNDANPSTIEREANLSAWSTATFSFAFRTTGVDAGDSLRVQVSSNGGGAWTTLETFTGPQAAGTRSYDISAYKAANTRIRFIEVSGYGNNDFFFVDNLQIKDSTIRAGHWEVRVDMSSAVTTGDDINAFGIRAHDGTSGSGGTEYNVYADSIVPVGANPPNSGTTSRAYTLYPYMTSGCTCSHNDFDFDSNSGNIGSVAYESRTGAFAQTLASATLSGDNVWNRDALSRPTSDTFSTDYGIWKQTATIISYLAGGTPNGNYGAEYLSNYTAAANPPAANPVTNSFRIYLPNDAGTAPVKPYLEQLLAARQQAGIGVQGRYTVTVRIENPTAFPIVFSTPSNIVTANVPGSGATYGGNAQVAQGSILSQPAVNGTGNVTWNPGTLAAGGTAILSYDVLVTFTSAGQRIPVTATPASGNGTRAQFLDETGNSAQARATYLAGPACELAVTQNLLTEVLVARFDSVVRGGATQLSWDTVSEIGTAGFNVLRVDRATGARTKVNAKLLPADVKSPQGSRYRFVDTTNDDPQPVYLLEEVTTSGRRNVYGPFVSKGGVAPDAPAGSTFDRVARTSTKKGGAAALVAKKSKPVAAMVGISQTGIVRVSASDLGAALNTNANAVESAIRRGAVSVTERGAQVAWTPSADGAALLFFGEKSDSQYSNERVYRIEMTRGTNMTVAPASPFATATASVFGEVKDIEQDAFAATVLPLDSEGDYWFWDVLIPGFDGYDRRSFTIDAPSVAGGDHASLQVRLQGAMADLAHRASVSLNGVPVGELSWSGVNAVSSELAIPAGLLRDGANTVEIGGLVSPGAAYDVFYVDGFTLHYDRVARPEGGRVAVHNNGSAVAAGPFAATPMVLDVTDRLRPSVINASVSTGGLVSFTTTARELYFSEPSATLAPAWIRGSQEPSLSGRNRADYLVITPAALRTQATSLAQLRERDGLQTFVADLDQVYDEFAGGNPSPAAVRDFIAATARWDRVPKYVVLVGGGTIDYRGRDVGPGLFPPFMTTTPDGLFASDARYADRDGDGVPDVALGRIPVSTGEELDAYVRKLDASARATAAVPMLFAADARDRGADFKASAQSLVAATAGRPGATAFIDDLGAAGVRNSLLTAWGGSPLVTWTGHGGLDRISGESVLTVDDVPALRGSAQLPVFVAMTCTINRFELGYESLGTALTRAADGGATAVWSASGLSSHGRAAELQRKFVMLAANQPAGRIGDLMLQSLRSTPDADAGSVYLLLGDPAVRVNLPPVTTASSGASKRGE